MPNLSVLLPVYNAQKTVSRSLRSLLNQNYPDFEICIIDDGSTDGTLEAISRFSDPRIKVHTFDENRGLVKALNAGIDMIDAKYIMRLDADDVCHENRVGRQIEFMEMNKNISVSGAWCYIIDRNQQKNIQKLPTQDGDIKARMLFNNPLVHPSMIFRRDVFEKHRYNDGYRHCEDYGLWVDMSIDKEISFANIPEPLVYKFENKGDNISHRHFKDQLRSCSILRQKLLQYIGVDFSDEEIVLHNAIAGNSLSEMDMQLMQWKAEEWLLRLQKANLLHGYVLPFCFDFELAQRWLSICEHSLSQGVLSPEQVLSSPLITNLNNEQHRLVEARMGCSMSR
jgi:glycosyltransferase involved in cell wall biosynthesis